MPPKKSAEEKAAEEAKAAQDRELRKSIDKESAIRDQIQGLTDQLEGVLEKSEKNSNKQPKLPTMDEDDKKKMPKRKKSLKDGPKRTISVQLPPEVFEEIQRDELKEDMETNKTLEGFMASQGLDMYLKALQRRGFKECADLAALVEDDMDTMKIKPVHKTRLLWICNAIKLNLESDGGAAPKVKKIKPKDADPDLPTDPHNAAAKKKVKKAATKKKPDKKGAAGKPSAAEARKAYAAAQKKGPPKKAPGGKAAAEEDTPPPPPDMEPVIGEPVPDDEEEEDPYPVLEGEVVGIMLPPQPAGVTRLIFGSGPFGITVYGTGNGLVVTHVEPEGSGADHGSEVGDHIVELNGVAVSPQISDREFVETLMSLSRPVILGFTRNGQALTPKWQAQASEPEVDAPTADAYPTDTLMVGGISMDEVDPEKELSDLFPGAGLGQYVEALREMGADKMEDLAYLRRSDLQDLDMEIHPTDKKKLLELGLVAFLTKEGLAECVAYIRSVGVDMVDDLVYLKQSDVALMDLKQEYKDKLMEVLGRES